ncbi:MAG: ABC transporter ATP-binding protein [Nocardioides sp.]
MSAATLGTHPSLEPGGRVPMLQVTDLSVTFTSRGRAGGRPDVRAVDGVSLSVAEGETVGIVGESGSGKSVSALAVLGLLPRRGVRVSGSVKFDGVELLGQPDKRLRDLRGREMSMVFQDPMTSLNPVISIGEQVTEVLRRHRDMDAAAARAEAQSLLIKVGIPDGSRRLKEYPHQMSGGMRQRALIAIALACRPRLLICDEPTTALDVTIQAQILDLLKGLVAESGTALMMITHDLGVVAGLCSRVHVMYAGRIVESAPRRGLFGRPRHPYTEGLLASIPRLDAPRGAGLDPIPGSPNDTLPWDSACAFAPRCSAVDDECRQRVPRLAGLAGGEVRCHHPVGESP